MSIFSKLFDKKPKTVNDSTEENHENIKKENEQNKSPKHIFYKFEYEIVDGYDDDLNKITYVKITKCIYDYYQLDLYCSEDCQEKYPFISIFIPSSIDGYDVRVIGKNAFANLNTLHGIVIPKTVKSIEDRAFYDCYNLVQVAIPESVKYFGKKVFARCNFLQELSFPSNITSIPPETFLGCYRLDYFVIPKTVRKIESNAFAFTALREIIIPEGVEELVGAAFWCCKELEYVKLPNSIKIIDNEVFAECPKLKIIEYSGTKDEWEKIEKYEDKRFPRTNWDGGKSNFVVVCNDALIEKK